MPKCTDAKIDFGRFGRRVIEADFSGGDLSSDGGLLLLRQVRQLPAQQQRCCALHLVFPPFRVAQARVPLHSKSP